METDRNRTIKTCFYSAVRIYSSVLLVLWLLFHAVDLLIGRGTDEGRDRKGKSISIGLPVLTVV